MNQDNFRTMPIMSRGQVESAVATFMSQVYGWMVVGIGISGWVSFWLGNQPEIMISLISNRILFYGLIIAQFAIVLALPILQNRMSPMVARMLFMAYAAISGVTLCTIFLVYTRESIFQVFGLTAFSFAGLSAVGFLTKRDLGPVGNFCIMGLWGLVGYGLMSMFFPDLMGGNAGKVYSLCGVVVFAGLTAYDTQKIKMLGIASLDNGDKSKNIAVLGALTLYLDFFNLFLSLLSLTGKRRN